MPRFFSVPILIVALLGSFSAQAGTFRVATYNLESYLDEPTTSRASKTLEAKARVRESIRTARPDILALQEMGEVNALRELQDSLKKEGLDLPHWELVSGPDTNIHVAILSKFPITARRPHTNENFLLGGRRHRVSRGFAEVDIQLNPQYSITLITAHLKSKRPVPEADESELRAQEARLLREKIEARLKADPSVNLVVLGDFNETKDGPAIHVLIGGGRSKLVDTRPAERNGNASSSPSAEGRNVTWTHYYAREDSYSRIDYILLSPGLAREWVREETFIVAVPNWGQASDHRPLVATFEDEER